MIIILTVLSGGTGTPKLLQGLKRFLSEELNIIVNTAEDTWINDLYVSPDVDTVLYTLADLINEDVWYGRRDDTFTTHETLKAFGIDELLRIGDKDRALKMHKAYYLKKGYKLCEIIDMERELFNIKAKVLPMSDDRVETKILTKLNGKLDLLKFHDFWVKRKGNVDVIDVIYENITYAKPCEKALRAIEKSKAIIIGPSNPITSIGPILAFDEIREGISKKKTIVVSPIVGNSPISGPAGKLMRAKGYDSSIYGIYEFYKDLVDILIIDISDKDKAKDFDCEVITTNIIMRTLEDKLRLAKEILELV
ncbi:LPPG:FO 2-phospho-L-lactate transferase [Methanocaldococcus villosus KIN24-T80]|uniref:2-phospho-L-lactate transferase n=1 Tax=Methanocaldococcus villosus KIN24-T80 TaxID=1069083 RepID=N6UTI0_9EURY|nr:2-phospho-L-lactate transferase [Methanocaldococcus villosus]ENN95619.1 LPPG:FO 2-phospho-L-lactate transferase [Methanocaldococcus villosus KIN24-T80]